jgi:uncharacterized membrane protein YdjX (TVP38/TMEM64 family)
LKWLETFNWFAFIGVAWESQKVIMRYFLIVFLLGSLAWFYYTSDLGSYLSLSSLKEHQSQLIDMAKQWPLASIAIYSFIYVLVTGLSLPGATVLTLAGGAVFGWFAGTIIVSFASTVGASLAFLSTRYLLQEQVTRRFGTQMQTINQGIEKEGSLYLFALRLTPLMPFFVVNLTLGLTKMPLRTFALVSQMGMLPGTILYVKAGVELGSIDSLSSIASPSLIVSFAAAGIFPLLAKKIISSLRSRRT